MSLNQITLITAAASAVVVMMTGGTFAKTYDALYQVNIHKADSKKSTVIDVLYEGEHVNVTQCDDNDWCFVTHSGPDGWVPMAALERASYGGGATIVFQGGGDFDFPHKPYPPVVVDPGPKHPKFPITNVGNLPVSVIDPVTSSGGNPKPVLPPNHPVIGGVNGGGNGGGGADFCTIHPAKCNNLHPF